MPPVSRRRFLQWAGSGLAGLQTACAGRGGVLGSKAPPVVVVIGGGFGGAATARYLRLADPETRVTLVEKRREYITCPASNLVIVGRPVGNRPSELTSLRYGYTDLAKRYGLAVVHDEATRIDPTARTVRLRTGNTLAYDRLIVAPGIDFRWNAVEGYDADATFLMPHAWKAGPQTLMLRRRLASMADGGLAIIAPPALPHRCPSAAYERAGLVASYLRTHKPRSKLLVLDAKDDFPGRVPLLRAWRGLYGDLIEWVPAAAGGRLVRVDHHHGTVTTDAQDYRPDLANVIPPQRAGNLARFTGLTDASGWCPVDLTSFESTLHPGIHVIGDAAATTRPKSAAVAHALAKQVAAAVTALLHDRPPVASGPDAPDPTCVPPAPDDADQAAWAARWYADITADTFGPQAWRGGDGG